MKVVPQVIPSGVGFGTTLKWQILLNKILELGSYNKSVTINPTTSSWVNHVTDYSSIGLLYPFTATLVLVDVPRTLCKSDWDNAL